MTEAELRESFGQRLRLLRRHRNLTQEQLAEATELVVNFIQTMEKGTEAPSFKTLPKIADALGVEVMELFRIDESIPLRKKVSTTNLRKSFGDRLRLLRTYRKIKTQKQLANMVEVTSSFIGAIEKGKESPSFETLAALSEALNVEVIELFRFDRTLPK